jgi:hypothetical protein
MKKNNPSLLTLQEVNDAYSRGDITYKYACDLIQELGLRPELKLTFFGKLKVYVRKILNGKEKLNVIYLKDYKRKV